MSYLDRPTWTGDILVGALLSIGAASASAIGLFCLGLLFVNPALVFLGVPLAFAGFLIGLWCSFVALLLFGAPGTMLLRATRAENMWSYATLGALAGLGSASLIFQSAPFAEWWLFLDAVFSGAVGGVVWWRSYRRHFQYSETLSG